MPRAFLRSSKQTHCRRGIGAARCRLLVTICGRADSSSQSECDGVSTSRKAQKYSQAAPKQSSTLSQPNSEARVTPLPRAGQTFRPATRAQPSAPCPNQGWLRHRPGKLESTQQNPAFFQLSIQWVAEAPVRSQSALLASLGLVLATDLRFETRAGSVRARADVRW